MPAVRPAVVRLAILAALCAPALARGQDPPGGSSPAADPAAVESRALALRRARAFLADGPGAPRPDLGPAPALEVVPAPTHPLLGPCAGVALRGPGGELRVLVTVELAGARPVGLLQPERECHVRRLDARGRPRDPAAIAAEVARRCRLSSEDLRARARAFLARAVEDAAARRFDLVREERAREGLCGDTFLFAERPREGVVACVENLARVTLEPGAGEVVAARWTDVRHERRAPPPVDAARAEAIARAAEPALGPRRGVALRLLSAPASERGRGDVHAVWGLTFEPSAQRAGERLVVRLVDADRGTPLGDP